MREEGATERDLQAGRLCGQVCGCVGRWVWAERIERRGIEESARVVLGEGGEHLVEGIGGLASGAGAQRGE